MPRIQMLEAGWKFVPPTFLPIRSFGVVMPALVLMNTKPWRNRRCMNTGIAVSGCPRSRAMKYAPTFSSHVELVSARQAPMPLARSHAGEQDELDAVRLDDAVLERTHDFVVAARNRQFEPACHPLALLPSPFRVLRQSDSVHVRFLGRGHQVHGRNGDEKTDFGFVAHHQ